MIRRLSLTLTLTCLTLTAPLGAQVGHDPSSSPFEDLRGRQGITLGLGLLNTGSDPAGVGPSSGSVLHARYEYHFIGPLWGISRIAYVPSVTRTVKDPLISGPNRTVGTVDEKLVFGDLGLAFNLTGNKSAYGLVPRISTSLGFVSTFDGRYDLGGYRFGSKLTLSYGIGARLTTQKGWDITGDIVRTNWKMAYPASYGGDGSPTDQSILGTRPLNAWTGNTMFAVGVTRYLFR